MENENIFCCGVDDKRRRKRRKNILFLRRRKTEAGKYSFGGEEKGRKYLEKENHLLAERENTRDGQVAT